MNNEQTKVCNDCKRILPISDFHRHLKIKDGHTGKCKSCTSEYRKKKLALLKLNNEWKETKKVKHREYMRKWERGTRNKEQKKRSDIIQKKRFPERYYAASACRRIEKVKGFNRHHWSYNKEHRKDIITLSIKQHALVHRFTIYDQERMMYRKLDGTLIDSRDKAIEYYSTLKD